MSALPPRWLAGGCENAAVVAVDAPCRWRVDGQLARACERELAADRICCFSTPTKEKATGHAFYTWMFAGMELFAALAGTHRIWDGSPGSKSVAICFAAAALMSPR
jgi:hypothetical protein